MRGKSAEKTERLRTKALDGLREKRTCREVCKVKNRIGKLKTVNGGLALQTSLGKNGVIVTYQQISCHLKIEAKMSIHYKTMAHLLKDSWSRRGKEYIVKLINQRKENLRSFRQEQTSTLKIFLSHHYSLERSIAVCKFKNRWKDSPCCPKMQDWIAKNKTFKLPTKV